MNVPATCRQLHSSGASVADLDLVAFKDNGHLPGPIGVLEHLLELCGFLEDIVI